MSFPLLFFFSHVTIVSRCWHLVIECGRVNYSLGCSQSWLSWSVKPAPGYLQMVYTYTYVEWCNILVSFDIHLLDVVSRLYLFEMAVYTTCYNKQLSSRWKIWKTYVVTYLSMYIYIYINKSSEESLPNTPNITRQIRRCHRLNTPSNSSDYLWPIWK